MAEKTGKTTKATKKRKKSTTSRKKAVKKGATLVIVESPSKARTLSRILGSGYDIQSSVGHIRDLPKSRMAIDVENDFAPEYILVRGKASIANDLKKRAEASSKVILASDPDREGEAIAWHLANILELDPAKASRVRMYEITTNGVKDAFRDASTIDMARVDAQQARRVLDRLVGYSLSPLLWKKIRRGLSAGRVQSAALKVICDREREIEAFEPQEYWQVTVKAAASDGRAYSLRVDRRDGETLIKDGRTMLIESADDARLIRDEILNGTLAVKAFTQKEGSRKPLPPFRTSTLQQDAARRLGFTPRRTMSTAQSLYEGVNIPGRGSTGLITYMRTDSLRIAPAALESARSYIENNWSGEHLPPKPNLYETKGRSQDAHEAIRPTDVKLDPESLKQHLSTDQYRLYDLIWRRFLASQMSPARIDRSTVEAESGRWGMRQSGATVVFEGWGALWPLEMKDETVAPAVKGEPLEVNDVETEQKFTRPPARYTEGGLVKALEEDGVGRPSTYATIVQTLLDRLYVQKNEEKRLQATPLGMIVNGFLEQYFAHIVDVTFTAGMEEELDDIEASRRRWVEVVKMFWDDFSSTLEEAEKTAESVPPPPPEPVGEDCPECGAPLVKKMGRFGEFIGCSAFSDPEKKCSYTKPVLKTIGVTCPKCGEGDVVRRRGKKGKPFYGCSRYPECDFVSWFRPTGEKCPRCGGAMVEKGKTKEHRCLACGWGEGDPVDGE